jgi:hypothetical protein
MLYRYVIGGLKEFHYHHPDAAPFFPRILWGPLSKRIVGALWCVIAGAGRLETLDRSLIERHVREAFRSLLDEYPGLRGLYFPSDKWQSVAKRIVGSLWPKLLKYEEARLRPVEPAFSCEACQRRAPKVEKSA